MGRYELHLSYAGAVFSFTGELDAELTRELEAGQGSTDPTEVSFAELYLPDGTNVADLVEQGHALDSAEGELYLDGRLVLVGRSVDPEYGDPELPLNWLSLTLRSSPLDDKARYPDAAAVVSLEAWTDPDPATVGRVYPWPFGRPGAGVGPGSPALLVQQAVGGGTQLVLVSDGWVEAATVILVVPSGGYDAGFGLVGSTGVSQVFTIILTRDALGRRVSCVDLEEHHAILPQEPGTEYHCQWEEDARSGALGDLLELFLRASSLPVDYGRLEVARASLQGYILAGYLDETVVPVEWIVDNLLPLAPFGLVADEDGIYPLVVDVDLSADTAVAHLVEGPDCQPASGVRWAGDPVNELTIRYAHRSDADEFTGTLVLNPDNDPYAEASRRRYQGDTQNGVYAEEIQSDVIWSSATAELVGRTILRRRAFRARERDYTLWPEFWSHLERGRVVSLTSASLGWTRRPGWIPSRTDDMDLMRLTVTFDEDPFRDER